MNPRTVLFLILSLSLAAGSLHAAADAPPPPPPLPEELEDYEDVPQPEVTIIRREDRVIEEVRIHGQLRYVKVTPDQGPPYYFIDTDGDGDLETRKHELDPPTINQWILKRW
ncbi:DUF2782 domain-containing protein [Thiohalophilus thiocyanatoxydans]|uniref:Uncharacterized protein DUF2782 n=1 Tax=Thiohalophilus thiocyanatoxydans TaxID=381308 RepID=A0A4R8IW04_9GAMM|nr:DUF2782 domain-containing protein [Thiohalophilus thiocyanatoxydans]TDY03680.1 uncharacterized protein DUF2782 [Thiohalophilus thiocyanatoxydans]